MSSEVGCLTIFFLVATLLGLYRMYEIASDIIRRR